MAHSDCGWTCGCEGKTVKSLENTRAIPERWLLRWWFTIRRGAISSVWTFYLSLPLPDCDGHTDGFAKTTSRSACIKIQHNDGSNCRIAISTRICAAEMAVRYAALSACRKVHVSF